MLAARRHQSHGARNPVVARGQLSGILLQERVVSLLPKPEIPRLQPVDASREGAKLPTTSEVDRMKRSLVRASEDQLLNLTSGEDQKVS